MYTNNLIIYLQNKFRNVCIIYKLLHSTDNFIFRYHLVLVDINFFHFQFFFVSFIYIVFCLLGTKTSTKCVAIRHYLYILYYAIHSSSRYYSTNCTVYAVLCIHYIIMTIKYYAVLFLKFVFRILISSSTNFFCAKTAKPPFRNCSKLLKMVYEQHKRYFRVKLLDVVSTSKFKNTRNR